MTAFKLVRPIGLSMTGGVSVGGDVVADGASVTPGPDIVDLSLTAPSSATHPWSVGHVFAQGDVPSGSVLDGIQTTIKSTWPDGSARFVIVAGESAMTADTPLAVTLRTGNAPTGTALTTADLKATGITAAVDAGAFGDASWAGTDWDAPFEAWVSGPVMSSWIYRQSIGADAHLVAWLEVRLWASGAVEVLPWVENGYLLVAGPTNKSATYSFTLGGSERFSAAIDVKHHTRVPLLTGSVFSYWLGADPAVLPAHDVDYMMSAEVVPTYGWTSPNETTLNGLQQTYAPNTLAGINASMGVAGSSGALIPRAQALYLTSGADPRAYRAALVFGLSGGSWSTHYRDESTNAPLRFSERPTVSLNGGGSPAIPAPSGGEIGSAGTTHQPSYGYLPALITGRYWFVEESKFWTTWNYLKATPAQRFNSDGILDTVNGTYATRGAYWSFRTLAQTLALLPPGDASRPDYIEAVENNADFYRTKYVDGGSYGASSFGTAWISSQGFFGDYSSPGTSPYGTPGGVDSWWGAAWMHAFGVQAWGFASRLGLPLSSQGAADISAVCAHTFKQVTDRASGVGGYNWRRFAVYAYPIGQDSVGYPPETFNTAAESLAQLEAGYSLSSLSSAEGLSLKAHSSDTDMVGASSTGTDYLPFALAGLAYAVDALAPNAAEGMRKIAGASNFNEVSAHLNDNPEHGVYPRTAFALPAWRSSLAAWEWTEIATASIAGVVPSPQPTGGPTSRINAWNGMTCVGSLVCMAGVGGHADWSGNEGYGCELMTETPTWSLLNQPTANADLTIDTEYYADGKPTSSHTYYQLHGDVARSRIFRMGIGSAWGSGNYQRSNVDAFDLTAGDWDTANTWPDVPDTTSIARAQARDYATDDVWACGAVRVSRWNSAAGEWEQKANLPNNGSATYYRASVFDAIRQRYVVLGDAFRTPNGGLVYSVSGNLWSTVDLTGASASAVAAAAGNVAYHDVPNDRYLVFLGSGAVVTVDPVTWEATPLSTTGGPPPAAVNGVFQKAVWVPAMKGYAYQPSGTSNLWFLASE
jgi:hypothetical protein